jgi:RHS repeat-associated protein
VREPLSRAFESGSHTSQSKRCASPATAPLVRAQLAPASSIRRFTDSPRACEHGLEGSGRAPARPEGSRKDKTHVYRNQGGNRFAPPIALDIPWRAVETAATIDLHGLGTTSIVYALPNVPAAPIRYVDLQQGKKPHLLTEIDNGLGRVVRFEYTSSTQFALADRKAGRPWVTKLPFPVQVVSRMQVHDLVRRARTVTTYRYHHGYYDGEEREFAGFAYVEEEDGQAFDDETGKGTIPAQDTELPEGWPEATNNEFFTKPALTKTWFHTGAWTGRKSLEQKLALEWWAGDGGAPAAPAITLPTKVGLPSASGTNPNATGFDRREAVRALRGAVLRREVYGLDDSADEDKPYVVETFGYDVRCLQPVVGEAVRPRDRTPGVAHRIDTETIHVVYDRVIDDPRVTHAIVLDVDDYATVTRDAVVAYARRGMPTEAEQSRDYVAIATRTVAHLDSGHTVRRLALPREEQLYELTRDDAVEVAYTPASLYAVLDEATAIAHHTAPTGGDQLRLLESTRVYYFDLASLPDSLDFTDPPNPLGLVSQTYRLDLTDDLLVAYGLDAEIDETLLIEAGYEDLDEDGRWWAPSGSAIPSPAEFYQPTIIRDPRERDVAITYDAYHLLVVEAVDPLTNTVTATVDYRSLAYRELTDPNGNRQEARFDGLGRVTHVAAKGKIADSDGDTIDDPTEQYQYDTTRWRTAQKPAFARALLREIHGPSNVRFLESYTYSDGGGAVVMVKQRVEPGPSPHHVSGVLVRDGSGNPVLDDVDPRWVGTGRTVLDNKGNPVKQYEPYFSDLHEYEDEEALEKWGVSPLVTYDPVGRVTRVDYPDETFETFQRDAWTESAFDKNDNDVGGPHENTPTTSHLDPLGRPFLVDQHNGGSEHLLTRVVMDLEGAVRVVRDAFDRETATFVYSMGGQLLKETNIDAGEHRSFANVMGSQIRRWDDGAPTRVHRFAYDALERPTHRWVSVASATEVLLQRMYYGESAATPLVNNLRGQLILAYDAAGQTKNVAFDFRGRLVETTRRLAEVYDAEPDWSALDAVTSPATAESTAASALETENFIETRAFDALGRPTLVTTHDDSETRPTYNEAGLLETVEVRVRGAGTWTSFVDDIDYDEKGRRTRIAYGNGTATDYTYDPLTYRLASLTTTRTSDSVVLQNLAYTYDPVGNILAIADTSAREPIFDNTVASPSATYQYDAVYRLTHATGREHAGGVGDVQRGVDDLPLQALPHPNDPTAVRLYEEDYAYDLVGNILELAHTAVGSVGASWTRHSEYISGSNRLNSTSLPGDTEGVFPYSAQYTHDGHGNITAMPHLASITHDHADRMKTADLGGGGTAHYVYRADGSRARKVIERIGTLIEERIYLGGWELYRKRDHTGLLLERETLHVMDDKRRVAMVETKTVDTAAGPFTVTPRYRFQLDDHIWSARFECDDTGLVISYEEFHPYGTSAYRSARSGVEVSERRYRYTGKERDDETGFQIHGLRYYCPWLGRWTTSDPIGLQGGLNGFGYCRGDPVGKVDPSGTLEFAKSKTEFDAPAPKTNAPSAAPSPASSPKSAARAVKEGIEGVAKGTAKAAVGLYLSSDHLTRSVVQTVSLLKPDPNAPPPPDVGVREAALNAANETINPAYSGAKAYEEGKAALASEDYGRVGEAGVEIVNSATNTVLFAAGGVKSGTGQRVAAAVERGIDALRPVAKTSMYYAAQLGMGNVIPPGAAGPLGAAGGPVGPQVEMLGVTVTPRGRQPITGDVNITPTLNRIQQGGSHPHPNDGSVFQNRGNPLPPQAQGYYREYVHPTVGVPDPGPQRIVTGTGGEVYYTPDHYNTFYRVK